MRAIQGSSTSQSLRRLLAGLAVALLATVVRADPIVLDAWEQFSFEDVGVDARGCDPDDPLGAFCIPSSGTPTLFLGAPPWTFSSAGIATVTVTDAFESGERFELFDFGVSLGTTSPFAVTFVADCGDDPVVCLATAGMSTGVFALGSGAHSLTLRPVVAAGPGSAYLLVSALQVPEPGSVLLVALGLACAAAFRAGFARR